MQELGPRPKVYLYPRLMIRDRSKDRLGPLKFQQFNDATQYKSSVACVAAVLFHVSSTVSQLLSRAPWNRCQILQLYFIVRRNRLHLCDSARKT